LDLVCDILGISVKASERISQFIPISIPIDAMLRNPFAVRVVEGGDQLVFMPDALEFVFRAVDPYYR
jgi:hypothetical protein